jgi:hypothetical protein
MPPLNCGRRLRTFAIWPRRLPGTTSSILTDVPLASHWYHTAKVSAELARHVLDGRNSSTLSRAFGRLCRHTSFPSHELRVAPSGLAKGDRSHPSARTPGIRRAASDSRWRARCRRLDRRWFSSPQPAPRSRAPCSASPWRASAACALTARTPRVRGVRVPYARTCGRSGSCFAWRAALVLARFHTV